MSDGDLQVIPEDPENPYRLGRHLWHDPRNRNFPVQAFLRPEIRSRPQPWWRRGVYNQGSEGSCTAQAVAGVHSTSPFRMEAPQREAMPSYDEFQERSELYREAQKHDPWPGENYSGSSTDAPFKVLRLRGHIKEWRWCFGLQDVLNTLDDWGPVAIGTNWYHDMFRPDRYGMVGLTGGLAGGHAYELLWNDVRDQLVRAINSWGRGWGQEGRFWLTYNQLGRLLGENGEAVTIVR